MSARVVFKSARGGFELGFGDERRLTLGPTSTRPSPLCFDLSRFAILDIASRQSMHPRLMWR
jgi:hypothetical protein